MNRTLTLIVSLACALPAFSADNKAMFAKHWQTAKDLTVAVAEAMPAEDYNFKPNPEEMVFGKQILHIALAQNSAFSRVSGIKAPAASEKLMADYKSNSGFEKAAVIQFLKESFDFCASAWDKITPDQLDTMQGPAGRQMSGTEIIWAYFSHTVHHRGQAEVYLRVKGITPPSYKF